MSEYCRRYIDDYPGIRAECERHVDKGRLCETCPNRNIEQEVRDLRIAVSRLRVPDKTVRGSKP